MKTRLIILFLACILFIINTAAASSSITGVVNHCDKGGVAGMMVYIPGKPHLIITGTDGKFHFPNVASGDYTLYFMLNNKIISFNKWVKVQANQTSDLQTIEFCDKIVLAPAESASTDTTTTQPATISQDLESICQQESEGTMLPVINGKASCKNSQLIIEQCDKGFSDCDQSASNGCEVDLINDDENCGSCFNACSDQDSCQLGFC